MLRCSTAVALARPARNTAAVPVRVCVGVGRETGVNWRVSTVGASESWSADYLWLRVFQCALWAPYSRPVVAAAVRSPVSHGVNNMSGCARAHTKDPGRFRPRLRGGARSWLLPIQAAQLPWPKLLAAFGCGEPNLSNPRRATHQQATQQLLP